MCTCDWVYAFEEDPEPHTKEGDGHSTDDGSELESISSNQRTAHDPRKPGREQPYEQIVHENGPTSDSGEAGQFLEGDGARLLESPILIPEETVGGGKQHGH